ncbi:hypothetical protein LSH36_870g00014 [Paralvinella palmiformis]|uniref:Hexosyltransferase n=1 Tax=Paralvinella palmiformis TaxID=53620 RepID=A0AAD9IZI3_9ANNE|nr:hypothetical protein LSH36_870g00014 [Paralvinella palmiformis]
MDSGSSPSHMLTSGHVVMPTRTIPIITIISIVFIGIILCIPFSTAASLNSPRPYHDDNVTWRLRHQHNVSDMLPPSGEILINEPRICELMPFAVIFVHSAPNNTDYRSAIRKSWASATRDPELRTRTIFVVGVSPTDRNNATSRQILAESATYGDILQFNMADRYENLSLKSLAMLRWVREFCAGVRYVIKADDDTFVNAPLLVGDLRGVVHSQFLMGDIIAGARPIRDRLSKYYTPVSQYNASVYPTYLSGAAYVISGDLIAALTEAASKTQLFWLEDVYVTGILGQLVRAQLIFNGKFAFRTQTLARCQLGRIIALHRINPEEMINAWKLVADENRICKHPS